MSCRCEVSLILDNVVIPHTNKSVMYSRYERACLMSRHVFVCSHFAQISPSLALALAIALAPDTLTYRNPLAVLSDYGCDRKARSTDEGVCYEVINQCIEKRTQRCIPLVSSRIDGPPCPDSPSVSQ